jgi:predicted O-methyltransferase YrrM
MNEPLWSAVDRYARDLLGLVDRALEGVASRSEAAKLPPIQVSECQGKFLELLVRSTRARRVLEIGTLGGFSTAFLARGFPEDGRVVSLELEPRHATVARANLEACGLAERVDVLEGDAHATLARMIEESVEPFDFVFLDAEKPGYSRYLDAILQLSRPGTVIVADNVVRGGEVSRSDTTDEKALGVRAFNERVAATPGLDATIVQTVGNKGHDGFLFAIVG